MNKIIVGVEAGGYTFSAANKTVTLTGLNPIALKQVLGINNLTTGDIIYNGFNVDTLGTISSNVITLVYDTSVSMHNTDELQIIIDYGAGGIDLTSTNTLLTEIEEELDTVNATLTDINIQNSTVVGGIPSIIDDSNAKRHGSLFTSDGLPSNAQIVDSIAGAAFGKCLYIPTSATNQRTGIRFNDNLGLSPNGFTLEWKGKTPLTTNYVIAQKRTFYGSSFYWEVQANGSSNFFMQGAPPNGSLYITAPAGSIVANTLVHLAVEYIKSTNYVYFYVNGIIVATLNFNLTNTGGVADFANDNDVPYTIGYSTYLGNYYFGYIEEYRQSNVARYGGTNHTPNTIPFVADANTERLLHFDKFVYSPNVATEDTQKQIKTGIDLINTAQLAIKAATELAANKFLRVSKAQPNVGEEIRFDDVAGGDLFIAIAIAGTATNVAIWDVVKYTRTATGSITRLQYKAGIKWDDRAVSTNWA